LPYAYHEYQCGTKEEAWTQWLVQAHGRSSVERSCWQLLLVASLAGSVVTASPASAVTGASYLCGPQPDYACTGGGYQGKDPWGYWQHGSSNQYGSHNCTSYAAFRAAKNGARNPGRLGDATSWDENARSYKIPVNGTPTVGAIAQWNAWAGGTRQAGHLAYVEEVGSGYIVTSDDNFDRRNGGWTSGQKITRNSGGWPSNFIHLKDPGGPGLPTALARNRDGRLELFGIGLLGELYHRWQLSPGGSWSAWSRMSGTVSSLAAATNADGRLQLFGVGLHGEVYHRWQLSPGGSWSSWSRMDGTLMH
jgi:surface antigen